MATFAPYIPAAISAVGALLGGSGNKSNGAGSVGSVRDNQNQIAAETKQGLDTLRPQQNDFAQQLAQGALGKGPSIADAQMKLAMQQNLQQQLAAAQAQRGVNPALAGRNALMAGAQANMGIAGQGGINRLQEKRNQQDQFQNYLANQQNLMTSALAGGASSANNYATQQLAQNSATNQLNGAALNNATQVFAAALPKSDPDAGTGQSGGGAPQQMQNGMAYGGMTVKMKNGGVVPGKEVEPGNSPKNDVVHAMLSSGEIVVPKTIVDKGGKAAAAFVDALKQHYDTTEKIKKMTYSDVLSAKSKKKGK